MCISNRNPALKHEERVLTDIGFEKSYFDDFWRFLTGFTISNRNVFKNFFQNDSNFFFLHKSLGISTRNQRNLKIFGIFCLHKSLVIFAKNLEILKNRSLQYRGSIKNYKKTLLFYSYMSLKGFDLTKVQPPHNSVWEPISTSLFQLKNL